MFRNRDILAYSEAILFLLTRLVYWSLVDQFRRLELYNIRNQKQYKSITNKPSLGWYEKSNINETPNQETAKSSSFMM